MSTSEDGGMVIRMGSVMRMASLPQALPCLLLAKYKVAASSIGSLAQIVVGGLLVLGNSSWISTSKDSFE